jgi:hypothetical protein
MEEMRPMDTQNLHTAADIGNADVSTATRIAAALERIAAVLEREEKRNAARALADSTLPRPTLRSVA